MSDDAFNRATSFVAKELGKFVEPTEEQQLKFYGLYKQANDGDCNTSKPWAIHFTAAAKWKAWNACKGISSEQAKEFYIEHLNSIYPEWAKRSPADHAAANSGGSMMSGGVFSRPIEDEVEIIKEDDKTILDYTSDGNLDKVKNLLKSGCDVDTTDNEGRTSLHIACDRGYIDIAKMLIKDFHANLNCQDMAKYTPLHFAVLCEEEEIVKLLLDSNADTTIKSEDNETPKDLADGENIRKLF